MADSRYPPGTDPFPTTMPPQGRTGMQRVAIGCGGALLLLVLAVIALAMVGMMVDENAPAPPSPVELTAAAAKTCVENVARLGSSRVKNVILPVLRKFQFEALMLEPQIPRDKLGAARKTTLIPKTEVVFALMDATVMGSAEHALLFADKGLYYFNGTLSMDPNPGHLPYTEFPATDFAMKDDYNIAFGANRALDISGMATSTWAQPTLQHVRVALLEAAGCLDAKQAPELEPK